jgi:glycosyltransferase involved in cell wall biosynthesis
VEDRVSVIIPTYNRSGLVGRAVESALAAIAPGDEVIVIDDGSTDDTAETLRPFRDKIRHIRTENAGAGAARNMGIKLANFPLVAFLDSDDEWLSDKLYLQRTVMNAFPHVVFCFSDLLSRHYDGKVFRNVLNIWRNDLSVGYRDSRGTVEEILGPGVLFSSIAALSEGREDFNIYTGNIYATLMEVYYVWTCSILVRKESAGNSFLFPEDVNIYEEWECFARLAKAGLAAYLDCELAVQNVHHGSRLTDAGSVQQASSRINLLNRVWGADESFLRVNSARFQSILKAQHLRRARYLIKAGRMEEAKEDLMTIGGGPWSYRVLTSLPSSLIGTILDLRKKLIQFTASR